MKYLEAMLAESEDVKRLDRLVQDDRYLAEQKIDGHRCLMHIEDGRAAAIARSCRPLDTVKPTVFEPFKPFRDSGARWVFDGEYLNGCYYVFDLLEAADMIHPGMPLVDRRRALEHFWGQWQPSSPAIALVPAFTTSTDKAALVERVRELGGEGVMFKLASAPYYPGKRSTTMLKVKFRHDLDCRVEALGTGGKKNMTLSLWHPGLGRFVEVGECTALAGDGPKVKVGDVVTVLCHGASQHDRVVQPTLPRLRHDKTPEECEFKQLDTIRINKTVLVGTDFAN